MEEKNGPLYIKSHKWSFILLGSGMSFLLLLFVISLVPVLFVREMIMIPGILFLLLLVTYFFVSIIYKKEKYEIQDTKIVRHYGSLISDNSVEVKLDRITEVSAILGFVQHKIFGTGTLIVKTAGSSSSRIVLKNISDTMQVYELLQEKMRTNGYHLKRDKLVQEEQPHMLGIIGELVQGAGSILLFLAYFTVSLVSEMGASSFGSVEFSPLYLLPVIIIVGLLFLLVALKYLDLRRRRYRIFTDTIEYTEGFLTKNYSIIPMERVADSENTQGFFSRIFGMHDVVVSSEGSNSKVVFKNMVNGEQMIKNIKYLKNEITLGEKTIAEGERSEKKEGLIDFTDKTEKSFKYNKTFTGKYKMDPLKTLLSSVLLLIVGVGAIALFGFENIEYLVVPVFLAVVPAIKALPQLFFTNYTLEESSIDSRYKFLRNQHQSFSSDKITMVKIKESLLDLVLGTCSVYFYSIGSSSALVFRNVKKTTDFKKNILEKVGIYEEEKKKLLEMKFTLMNFLKANIGTAVFFGIIFILMTVGFGLGFIFMKDYDTGVVIPNIFMIYFAIIVIFLVIFFLRFFYQKVFFSKRFYRQKLAETYFESKKGILLRTAQYARLDNVKGMYTKKYPLTKTGSMSLRISGEVLEQTQKNKQQFTINSLRINILYLANIFALHDYFDDIITDTTLDTTEVYTSNQDIGNSIVFLVFLAVVFTLIFSQVHIAVGITVFVFFAIILGFVIWSVKVRKYIIQKGRILTTGGIIYKTKHSIVFEKFNYIEKNQGVLGKIFRNGNLSVYTLGSGSVDMKMSDVDKYNEMYDMLKD